MSSRCRKVAIAACAAIASLGALRVSLGAPILIEDNESAMVDGWNISAPAGVALTVTTNDGQIDVEKVANFTVPNQGLLVGFQYVGGNSSPATVVDFADEMIANSTGQPFSGFDFILMNPNGLPGATFPSVSNVFAPPTGTGYNYTSVNLDSTGQILSYSGVQGTGTTSSWGSANPGDNLLIDVASGTDDFALKELSEAGSGSVVPVPAAAWQSLAGLGGLALIGLGRRLKQRRLA